MGMFEWLKDFFGRAKPGRIIDGLKIPEAYTPLEEWEQAHPGKAPPPSSLRKMNGTIPFIFDETNQKYQKFFSQCQEDTKSLGKAITHELDARDLPLWPSQKKFSPAKKKKYMKLSFIIRPIFFSSEEEKTEATRWQGEGISFVLHFDENHIFQFARLQYGRLSNINFFKNRVVNELLKKRELLAEAYGNWPLTAKIIVDICEENKEFLVF